MLENELPCGSSDSDNQNLAYAFKNNDTCIFVFWNEAFYTTHIVSEPLGPLPEHQKKMTDKPLVQPSFTQLRLLGGMSYVIQLCDESYIIIDGGDYNEEDEKRLYDFLRSHASANKPTVELWFFTHPHYDHIALATSFIEHYSNEFEIKAFSYQFQDCDKASFSMPDTRVREDIDRLEKSIHDFCPNAVIYTLHTGQIYRFGDMEIEILWAIDNTYPMSYTSCNDLSAALRLKSPSDKTVLMLGDYMINSCKPIAATYGSYLKSDILQVAHHGLIGGDVGLYKLIDPEICFWPVPENVFLGKTDQRYKWCLGEGGCDHNAYIRDDSIRKRQHFHAGKTTTIYL